MPFRIGQPVHVTPPMTPCASHRGTLLRRSKNGWRVRYCAWGVWYTETFAERHLRAAD